ncbi:Pls/PosA family non-ribosomal peptide synthetase [Microbispora catharanthi]|uniref:Amino acid adenylation domain-containing protein n=1 Tax=Microbispora catharanthi TaxID=1712871 RepID=A0A5N6BR56_9ACTN|nr:Pls/PosA family non-ribosomal peptide synthetase [Microbispora catharanthi]KAB8182919.1 amino acid adenylation domain-containing protein [Microbispora catharanthi]
MPSHASRTARAEGGSRISHGGSRRRLHHVFEARCDLTPRATALECGQLRLTYAALDARANRLAHLLRDLGIGRGARIAILLPRSVHTYVALLAVGKAGAAFVPIDPQSPPDRVGYILDDAGADLVLTTSDRSFAVVALGHRVLDLDASAGLVAAAPVTRPLDGAADDDDPVAYVMYTSGSSGRPKGVEVAQSSICNFLDVVPGLYGVRPHDRVYQGMTISFDFSVEEIWPTWSAGAALVAGPAGLPQFGAELADFLDRSRITMLYCVPTLLATIPRELPSLRTLIVGGEPCPPRLVERWSRPGRRILNTYGPTEATVTATCAELLPGRRVTIGRPLPTYSVVLLDERRDPVPDGEVGEICIGGPGVARGYIGRPDLTADRFIEHPLASPGGRLYRTGDLGRVTATGEIEYLGRADSEVKIRGHRVDLGEIENVLLEDAGVAEAVAALMPVPGTGASGDELAAYVVPAKGNGNGRDSGRALVGRLHDRLRRRLPSYMLPSFLDVVAALPAMPSGKVDRRRLPPPTGRRLVASGPVTPAESDLETRLREVWAEAFGVDPESLSVEADFFTDLGGHSLLAARVVSLLRAGEIGAGLAVRDLYANPTVRRLAAHLGGRTGVPPRDARAAPLRHGGRRIALAGAVQSAVIYLLLLVITLPVSVTLHAWTNPRADAIPHVPRRDEGWLLLPGDGGALLASLALAAMTAYLWVHWLLPVLLARPLAAGVRPGRYPLWGATYLRLWALQLLLSVSPLPLLSGSPMMGAYLRLLGARVGPGAAVVTGDVNLPTMLRIGAGASVGYRASLHAWLVVDGWVVVAPVEVGPHAFLGNGVVLGPGARVGAHAGLGDQSALTQGETVPDGARWAGSPPSPVESVGPAVETMLRAPAPGGWKARHVAAAVVVLGCLEAVMLASIVPSVLVVWAAVATWGLAAGPVAVLLAGPLYVVVVCAAVAVGKRLILPKAPVGVHPARSWLGVRKWAVDKLLEFSLRSTNSLYGTLYTSPWLRLLGARVGRRAEVSTAAQLDPDLLTLSEESFVADMASVGAAGFARGRVAFLPTEVGRRAFVGNAAVIPAGTRMGSGSLVGVSTVPPRDGVPEGTSWLGSPAIHLPVRQDSGSFSEDQTFRPPRRLVLHRLGVEFFRATLPAMLFGAGFYLHLLGVHALARVLPLPAVAAAAPLVACSAGLALIGCCVGFKRRLIGVYRARVEPLWSRFVRRTEFVTGLYEAAAVPAGVALLAGTPFLPPVLRWFGARIGRRTCIATTYLTEFDLVEIGDDVAIGSGVSLQTHLFEDRVMKMSTVTVRSGASIGPRAVVLYDSVVGEDVSLGALSLLMKGEQLTPGTSWRGIPAQTAPA